MKSLKLLSMLVFFLCLVSTVSAIGVYADWEDSSQGICTLRDKCGNCQSVTITEGESIDFNGDFISINPPMTLNIVLYDAQDNVIEIFESNLIVSDTSYFPTYTIDSSIYSTPGFYELVLSGSDKSSVPAQAYDDWSLTLIVTTAPDPFPPVITLLGDNPVTVVQGTTYTDAGATAWDDVDGDLTANIIVVNPVDVNTVGTYTITYNVQDNAGNHATQVTRTVTVVEEVTPDRTAPVITLLGNAEVNIVVGTSYIDAGATALDNVDGDITANIVTINNVDTSTLGTYLVTYNVQDSSGNSAVEITRTVTVVSAIVDTTAPVITLLGNNLINIAQGTAYTDAGATALDNVDGDITANIVIVNPVDTDTVGIYTITYNVQDNAGNSAVEITRIVNVFDPNDEDKKKKTTTDYYQSNYDEQLYLDQFKPKKIIYLEDDEQPEKVLNWWQKFIEWLKNLFGFN